MCTATAAWSQPTPDAVAPLIPTKEQWDVLPLKGNKFYPQPVEAGEKDVLPNFTRELLRVEWRSTDPIDLYVIRPAGLVHPPVIVFLYSYPSDTERFRNDKLCETLTRNGFAAVGFVSALTGQRYHDRPMKEWFVSELQESLGASVHDVQLVLNYLQTRGDLDMDRVGLFGQGSGGTIAILSAAVDPRIKAVDAVDPWGDWPDWLARSPRVPEDERPGYLTPEFLAKVAPLDPLRWLPQLADRPLRLEQTLFTPVVPEEARAKLRAALPPESVAVQYKTPEEYKQEAVTDGKILDWLKGRLQAVQVRGKTVPPSSR